jgi:formylglycine-generating enzyme required for sulfatase activity
VDLVFDKDGVPSLVLMSSIRARQGEPLCRPARTTRVCQDWLRFAVVGVGWDDAQKYIGWLASGPVAGARLCSELEWERAARGADGRLFAHGDVLHPGDVNYDATYGADQGRMGIDEVGSYPSDRSVFGVADLGGNVAEWVAGDERPARGGTWLTDPFHARASWRYLRDGARLDHVGIRVCAPPPPVP